MKNFTGVSEHGDQDVILTIRAGDDDKEECSLLTNRRDIVNEEFVSLNTGEDHNECGEVLESAEGDKIVSNRVEADSQDFILTDRTRKCVIDTTSYVRGGMQLSNTPDLSNQPPVKKAANLYNKLFSIVTITRLDLFYTQNFYGEAMSSLRSSSDSVFGLSFDK